MSPASKVKASEGTRRAMPTLDDFVTTFRDNNPFIANRVTEPSSFDVDVPAIHAAKFDRLVALAGQAMRERTGLGVALLGAAGVGKSHLLSRLYRWANEPTEGGRPRACYVYLHNILADPDRLPRYLLKYVISRLTEGGGKPPHQTPLYRFVESAIWHAIRAAGARADSGKEVHEAYRSCFSEAGGWYQPYEVLFQFLRYARPERAADPARRRAAAEAVAWLSGDEVDPDAALWLGLKADGRNPTMLRDNQEVEQVLLALAKLALVSRQPFVLCIDQVDNLDPDKLRSLVQFLHALIDHGSNLLVVTSGVKASMIKFKEDNDIPEAAWDRIARFKVELSRVSRADARNILEARLERFLGPFVSVEPVRQHLQEDTLFPLGRGWLDRQLADGIDFRPRDILTWASDEWEVEQDRLTHLGGEGWLRAWPAGEPAKPPRGVTPPVSVVDLQATIDAVVDRKIEEQVAQHRLQPGSLPPDAGNLAGLVEVLLGQCQGDGLPYTFRSVVRMKKKGGVLPPYDLLVRERREADGREVTTGVAFVTNVGLSATAALRRLLEDDKPPDHRLLVTDQERRPLKVGPQGVEYYKGLEKLGRGQFEHLKIDFEQYARLDALRDVVGMARSGDLEIESPPGTPRAVIEAEVIASHHRKDRYRQHPLLRPLLTEEPPPKVPTKGPKPPALDEKDVRQYIMAQLAWMMGTTSHAIAKGYIQVMKAPRLTHEVAWPQIKRIAGKMHADGHIHATPQDDDLFLLLKK